MKLYEMFEPRSCEDEKFFKEGGVLYAALLTVDRLSGHEFCDSCRTLMRYVKPKRIYEWDEDSASDIIGDFTWNLSTFTEVVITEKVRNVFRRLDKKLEFLDVEYWQNPKAKPPKRITKRTRKRVWLPYTGPKQYVLWTNTIVSADPKLSSMVFKGECGECGHKDYTILPVYEKISKDFYKEGDKFKCRLIHRPREEGKGLFVHKKDLRGAKIFRVNEGHKVLYCTEEVKEIVEEHKFTNVAFLEWGDIID